MPTNPELLKMPFAQDGDKNSIPETTSPTTGLFSQQYGFQNINSLPLTAGGKAISRLDYNGAMYMLSNLLYYMQRGYTFVYDDTMDYLVGCQVLDPNDGQVYICTANAVAGTGAPSVTPDNWEMQPNAANLDLKVNPTFDNIVTHKETFTTSGTFEAPVTGLYKITLQGGGGGGGGAGTHNVKVSGGGGGSGAKLEFYDKLISGTTYSYVIGAGGTGGAAGSASSESNNGSNGGDSSITINSNDYVAGGGGGGGGSYVVGASGLGGVGKINDVNITYGAPGGSGMVYVGQAVNGGNGGGAGGGIGFYINYSALGSEGGGGNGGGYASSFSPGGDGAVGYISFEYCSTT